MNIALCRFLQTHGNMATKGSPKSGLFSTLIDIFGVLYCAQSHRRHCTFHAFEQFEALYMHNPDDKYPARPGFEPSTFEFRATTGLNKPLSDQTALSGIHKPLFV